MLSLEKILEKISEITLQIQQGRSLEDILQWTIDDARTFLQTDRVLIYRFLPNEDAVIAFESVGAEWTPLIGQLIYDPCLKATWVERYRQGQITTICNIHAEHVSACQVELLERLQVQANLVVPILHQGNLWGLLIAHHCRSPREWQPIEVQYLQQMTLHLSIAIQQTDLRQEQQRLVAELGGDRRILDRGTPRFMPDGSFAGFIGSCTDGSDRKQAEQALGFQEALLRSMTDASPLAFYVVDNRTDQILYFNHRFCQIWGIEHLEAAMAQGHLKNNDIIPDCISLILDVPAFAESCKPLQSEENRDVVEDEIALVDGRMIRRFSSQIRDHRDQYFGRLYLFEDITDRKQLEKSLWLADCSLEHLAVSATWIDRHARICRVNETICTVLGYSREELEAMSLEQIDPHFSQTVWNQFWESLRQQKNMTFVSQYVMKNGEALPVEVIVQYTEFAGEAYSFAIAKDIRERLQTEKQLRLQSAALKACADSIVITDCHGIIEWANPAFTAITGYSLEEAIGKKPRDLLKSGQHNAAFYQSLWKTILSGQTWRGEIMNRRKDGSLYTELATITPVQTPQGEIHHFVAIKQDISDRKRVELAIQQQTERERMIQAITGRIRQSLDLTQILYTTVTEVRRFLVADRVLIYRFNPDWSGVVIAESVAAGWQSMLGMQTTDTYFVETQGQAYLQGRIGAVDDIYTAGLAPCHIEMMEQIQVRAKLVVPILQNTHLWGLLVAHHCQESRHWEAAEIALQQQLATQIAIAIQQSELYQQLQALNMDLELQVQERTAQLQQALDFEALLKRITDQVRDSLDEDEILQKVVQELTSALGADCCDTALYSPDRATTTIKYESRQDGYTTQNSVYAIADSSDPNLYAQLFRGRYCHFCLLGQNVMRLEQTRRTTLAVPIMDEQGILGDMWLFKPPHEVFDIQEIRLVQQVANQCAIALRQSRLYQAAQTQVQELERLNRLKDDFLSTVSHELRSPMANIKAATQLLEISLDGLGVLDDESTSISRYFKVLQEEGQREINLINDLLALTRLDAETEPLRLTQVSLQFYIPHLAETFVEQMQQQQQQLVLQIPADLPLLTTDLPYLERILAELLHNACKYTPIGETITVSAQFKSAVMEICITNSGVEISPIERDRIFDKFYRIPNNDPWKHSGTGLGLALVKKLVEKIGGAIDVESTNNQTCFVVRLSMIS